MIRLIVPSKDMEERALTFMESFFRAGEREISGSYKLDNPRYSYADWLELLEKSSSEATADPRFGVSQTFFAEDEAGELAGVINLRYTLTPFYLNRGHIGCSVAPGKRRMGYGSAMLEEALELAKAHGLGEVRLVCRADNTASKNMMRRFGPVLRRVFAAGCTVKEEYSVKL